MARIGSPLTSTFVSIKKQFIAKEKLIKSSTILQKKSSENKRRNEERERSLNYENTLEKTLSFLGKPIKSIGKKLSFLDSLKQFITRVLLGFIAVRMLKYLPQLMNVFTMIVKVGNFILDISGKLLNGLVTFIDKGYQAADHAKNLVKSIGGEKAIQSLDEMSNQANSLLNSIIIAGMLFSDFGGVGTGGLASKKAIDATTDIITDTLTREGKNKIAQEAAKQGIRSAIGPLGAAGIVLGVGLLSSAIGEGAFQIKKFGKQLQGWTSGKLTEASQDKNPVTRFLKKGFFGWLSGTLGPAIWLLNGTGVMFDIVGAPFRYGVELIRAAVMKLNDNRKGLEEQNKNLGKFDARVRDGIREQFSILAPLFQFVGMKGVSQKLQTPGSFGSLYGEKAAKDMGYYRGGLVIKKFAGGGYTRSVGDEDKKVEIPRTFNEQLPAISPGSAVGGSKMITKVFPYNEDNGVMNQYDYVSSAYSSLSGSGSVGNLSALVVKSLIGDRVTNRDYKVASNSLSSFLMSAAASENPEAYSQAFSILGTDNFQSVVGGELKKTLGDTLGQIENQLRIQLGLKVPEVSKSATDMDCECPDESGGGEVVAGEIPPEGKALLDAIAGAEAGGYNARYPSKTFNNGYRDHPRIRERTPDGRYSDAAGRYQFLSDTWDPLAKKLGLKDFSPANQDRAGWQLAVNRYGYGVNGIIKDLRSDPMKVANKLNGTWPSLPGGSQQNNATKGFLGRFYASVKKYQGQSSTAKISPGSSAADVSSCVCDPETPDGDPGDISGAKYLGTGTFIQGSTGQSTGPHFHIGPTELYDPNGDRWVDKRTEQGKADSRGAAFQAIKGFIKNKIPITLTNSGYITISPSSPPDDSTIKQYIIKEQIGHATRSGGGSWGGLDLAGAAGIRFPLAVGPVVSSVHWFGNAARILGTKAFVGHGAPGSTGSREGGGPTGTGGIRLLHKGEYVIDKDSVDLFGGIPFFRMINRVENEKDRKEKSSQLIKHLSKYTGRKIDQRQKVIFKPDENSIVISPPIYVITGSSGGFIGGESPNWEQDILSMRG